MVRFPRIAILTAGLLLVSKAVFADVTAQDVWTDLQSYLESTGYAVSTDGEATTDNGLLISGLVARFDIIDKDGIGEGKIELALEEIRFRELSNGSVEIGLSDEYTIAVTGGEDAENLNLVLTTSQTGLSIIAGGNADVTSYDIVAAGLSLATTTFEMGNEPVEGHISMDLSSYTGSYVLSGTEVTTIRGEGRIDAVDISASVNEPEQDMVFNLSTQINDLSVELDTNLPQNYDSIDISEALAQGFGGRGAYVMSGLSFDLTGTADGDDFEFEASTGPAEFGLSLDADGFSIAKNAKDLSIALAASALPLPQLIFSAADYGIDALVPIMQSPEPQDFSFGLRLVDLVIPDEIWLLGDPGDALSHHPLTLVLQTSGTSRLLADPFDPEISKEDTLPAELSSFNLDDLEISAVGTNLTGRGGFVFDNTDTTSFDGMPRPEGRIDLRLTGANALLDALVAMGVLPEDQALGARMMMGLFAVAGPGEDEMSSTIEINAEGQVLANGQRLR